MDKIRIHTYRQVWCQEHMIYQIEGVRLPFPLSLRQGGTFGALVIFMAILSRIPGAELIPAAIRYLLVPGLLTWFLTKQKLDGKPPLKWLASWIVYLFSLKRLNRLQPLERKGRFHFSEQVAGRRRG